MMIKSPRIKILLKLILLNLEYLLIVEFSTSKNTHQ